MNKMTQDALDKGYSMHIQKLYEVLTAASEQDLQSGAAIKRFTTGLDRAREIYDEAVLAATS